ncbi:hypothetical protein [Actinocatenispora rupis]|uniref:Uncharacterized protein n=1 Tax=Actinocatenispora rupis TaxID=519421 RepID=A0A8J3J3Z8_9ACTN|nr:hypothetical protein [Actinocatenispora rupis]GID14250.1 hypothetical protein Aru02nite_51390 [Actinocatenispora rupis]
MPAVPPEEQRILDATIGRHVLAEMYEDDTSADLTVEVTGTRIGVVARSSRQSMIIPSEDLLTAVAQMVGAHEHQATGLTGVAYRYQKDPDGQWTMHARFSYAD